MKLGDVVLVVGQMDKRIRDLTDEDRVGTIVFMYGDEVEVLFQDGNIWRGLKREIVKHDT